MVKQKKNTQQTDEATEPITIESVASEDIRSALEETKKSQGVIGYILRNATSAAINLEDSSKMVDYAVLASSTIEASDTVSGLFDIGKVKSVMIEGEEKKMLVVCKDGNDINIFMEKNADTKKLLKKIC